MLVLEKVHVLWQPWLFCHGKKSFWRRRKRSSSERRRRNLVRKSPEDKKAKTAALAFPQGLPNRQTIQYILQHTVLLKSNFYQTIWQLWLWTALRKIRQRLRPLNRWNWQWQNIWALEKAGQKAAEEQLEKQQQQQLDRRTENSKWPKEGGRTFRQGT